MRIPKREWKTTPGWPYPGMDVRGEGALAIVQGPRYSWLVPVGECLPFDALDPALQADLRTLKSRARAKARREGWVPPQIPAPRAGRGGLTLDPLAGQALDSRGGRNETGRAFIARALVAGFGHAEIEAYGERFVREANERQPFDQSGRYAPYTLAEYRATVRGSWAKWEEMVAIARGLRAKAEEERLRGAALACLEVFVGLMLTNWTTRIELSHRGLKERAGISSKQTVSRCLDRLVGPDRYLLKVGVGVSGALVYELRQV